MVNENFRKWLSHTEFYLTSDFEIGSNFTPTKFWISPFLVIITTGERYIILIHLVYTQSPTWSLDSLYVQVFVYTLSSWSRLPTYHRPVSPPKSPTDPKGPLIVVKETFPRTLRPKIWIRMTLYSRTSMYKSFFSSFILSGRCKRNENYILDV